MKLERANVLITGASGFIGSHLVERLIRLGAKVKAYVHYNSRNDWGLIDILPEDVKKNIEIFTGDIQDPFSVKKAVKGNDVVFHLAALISIPYSYNAPDCFINTNIKGTLNVMHACLETDIKKVIHTSTSEVYGTAQYVPIDESHPIKGQSPYSASKIAADKIAESYYLSFDLPVAVIRPFNTYGPRQSARAIIPTILTQALSSETIQIGSMEPIRDFNYISDTINGFIKIAESEKSIGQIINIGSGTGLSIKDLLNLITKILNRKIKLITKQTRIRPVKSEVKKLICNYNKAKELIGYEPLMSLESGLIATIDFYQKNLARYKPFIFNI